MVTGTAFGKPGNCQKQTKEMFLRPRRGREEGFGSWYVWGGRGLKENRMWPSHSSPSHELPAEPPFQNDSLHG